MAQSTTTRATEAFRDPGRSRFARTGAPHFPSKENTMFMTRWEPWTRPSWNGLSQLHNEVNRHFDRWDGNQYDVPVFPPVNLFEDEEGYHLEAEMPGLD